MHPRSAKKASGGSSGARKTSARTAKGTPKTTSQPHVAPEEPATAPAIEVNEDVMVEEVPTPDAKTKEEVKVEEVTQEKKAVVVDYDLNSPGATNAEFEENAKESMQEEDQGERLELEDNDPEYEEDTAIDYDDRDIEHEGGEEEGDDADYGEEGDIAEDEEPDMTYKELEDGRDVQGEEDYENIEEDHEIDAEEEEHHEVVKEHKKRKEFEVFVGGLEKDATEDDLRKVFAKVGEITEIRLMMNSMTKKNKGFAFLRFATVDQAKRAVSELKNPVVRGKQCGVAPSQDNDTLFVGNICQTWTKEHLKDKLKSYGVENMEDLTLVEDSNNKGMNRGFAFLEFLSRSDAMDAYRCLQKRDVVFGVDRTAKVSFADSFAEPDYEIMAQVRTVFVDGLPAAWDEDRVKECLKKYGSIEKVELARNMLAAKRKDFGFVTFGTHDNALACAEGINNAELGEGANKVKIRARLSRPHQKGRVRHGLRGNFRAGHGAPRVDRAGYLRPPLSRRFPVYPPRPISGRGFPMRGRGFRRPFGSLGYRDRRPFMAVAERPRRLPPPQRPYERRMPVLPYPKNVTKRDYGRLEELPPPRSRAAIEYGPRVPSERCTSYRDDYSSRESAYSDISPRHASRPIDRRAYIDDGYGEKLERPLPPYREERSREYDSLSGSKRPYADLHDTTYADVSMRQSRARLDYGVSSSSAQYGDGYGDRLGRSHVQYSGSRASLSSQDGLYGRRQGMSYAGGAVRGTDIGGTYSSGYSGSYMNRSSNVGSSSYSSLYSGRSLSGNGYLGGSGSGSYY